MNTLDVDMLKSKTAELLHRVFIEIRYLMREGGRTKTEVKDVVEFVLNPGQIAWVETLTDIAHNIPLSFQGGFSDNKDYQQVEDLQKVVEVYRKHKSQIIADGTGWTRNKILDEAFKK